MPRAAGLPNMISVNADARNIIMAKVSRRNLKIKRKKSNNPLLFLLMIDNCNRVTNRSVKSVSEEIMPIMPDEELCKKCRNEYIDCDHCLRNPDYQEPNDCYEPKEEDEQ